MTALLGRLWISSSTRKNWLGDPALARGVGFRAAEAAEGQALDSRLAAAGVCGWVLDAQGGFLPKDRDIDPTSREGLLGEAYLGTAARFRRPSRLASHPRTLLRRRSRGRRRRASDRTSTLRDCAALRARRLKGLQCLLLCGDSGFDVGLDRSGGCRLPLGTCKDHRQQPRALLHREPSPVALQLPTSTSALLRSNPERPPSKTTPEGAENVASGERLSLHSTPKAR